MRFSLITAVSVGAVAGALVRFGFQRWLNASVLSPLGTLIVNVLGSILIGFLVGGFGHRTAGVWYYGMTAGFCGSLTTFSSITMEVFEMVRLEEGLRAVAYVLTTFTLGILGVGMGYWLGIKILR
ncbi:MAG: CrcB family protein [Bacteroidia bacterium]|nr:CrcB family protein [Bacteroidia bacterium]MCX7652681.1 CrcB family protein [Bacteroidia bacterium]MDW8416965.1 CrcB family protein [Bacteroidia bacterium]